MLTDATIKKTIKEKIILKKCFSTKFLLPVSKLESTTRLTIDINITRIIINQSKDLSFKKKFSIIPLV